MKGMFCAVSIGKGGPGWDRWDGNSKLRRRETAFSIFKSQSSLVPAQRVLGHHRSADHLRALAGGTATGAENGASVGALAHLIDG